MNGSKRRDRSSSGCAGTAQCGELMARLSGTTATGRIPG